MSIAEAERSLLEISSLGVPSRSSALRDINDNVERLIAQLEAEKKGREEAEKRFVVEREALDDAIRRAVEKQYV